MTGLKSQQVIPCIFAGGDITMMTLLKIKCHSFTALFALTNMKLIDLKYYCTDYLVWGTHYIEISSTCRLYYFPEPGYDERGGFMFCGLTIDNPNTWELGDVNYFFSGSGVFDGVRHMFMSCDDEMDRGYQNYPDLELIIKFFQELRKLECIYCPETT